MNSCRHFDAPATTVRCAAAHKVYRFPHCRCHSRPASDFQASTKTMLPKHLADAPAPIAQELTPEGEIADETGRQMERSFLARFAQFLQPAPEPTERSLERTVSLPLLTGAQPHLSSPADIGGAEAGDG